MPAKKQSANWYIAATHYLTAGFVVPLLGGLVAGILLAALNVNNPTQLYVIRALVAVVLIYLGVMYSARYVNKTYVITDARKIVNLSTIYIIVLSVIFIAFPAWYAASKGLVTSTNDIQFQALNVIITVVVFYFASKKYIKAG